MCKNDFVAIIIIVVGDGVGTIEVGVAIVIIGVATGHVVVVAAIVIGSAAANIVVLLTLLAVLLIVSFLLSCWVKMLMAVAGILPLSFVDLAAEVVEVIEVLLVTVGFEEVATVFSTWITARCDVTI